MKVFFSLPIFYLLLINFLSAQCPEREFLWKRLTYLHDSSTLSPKEQLKELMAYEKGIKNCTYLYDSTHAFLLQRIGAAYYYDGDFLKAIPFFKNAISIISENKSKPTTKYSDIIINYFSLSLCYTALNMDNEANEVTDSSLSVSLRLQG